MKQRNKINYTDEQKIKYYENKILKIEKRIAELKYKIEGSAVDEYQDWSERVTGQIRDSNIRDFVDELMKRLKKS